MTHNPTNSNALAVVTEVVVTARHVICPHCDAECGDWLGDPRGHDATCDECGQAFHVHQDADLEMDR